MMAKLYWRVKQNGKWTWTPAFHEMIRVYEHNLQCECEWCIKGEEE